MTRTLFLQAIAKFLLGIVLVGLLIFLLYPILIAKRIRGEEELLERELAGYREYKQKVKYRLIPFIW